MKDLPHHMKKLNRKVIRSAQREEREEKLPEVPTWPVTKQEKRKKAKQKIKQEREAHVSSRATPEEQNKVMKKGRVPVFDRENARPKRTPPTKKKTPRF